MHGRESFEDEYSQYTLCCRILVLQASLESVLARENQAAATTILNSTAFPAFQSGFQSQSCLSHVFPHDYK